VYVNTQNENNWYYKVLKEWNKMMIRKKDNRLDTLIQAAEKEIYQFSLNETFYTVDTLVNLGLGEKIPNLIKLNKKTKNVKIQNLGGMPMLKFRSFDDEED